MSRDTTEDDVRHFLSDCTVVEVLNGADEGVVFVRLADQQDFEKALAKDNHELRWQKVGVFSISQSEYGRATMIPPARDQGGVRDQAGVRDQGGVRERALITGQQGKACLMGTVKSQLFFHIQSS